MALPGRPGDSHLGRAQEEGAADWRRVRRRRQGEARFTPKANVRRGRAGRLFLPNMEGQEMAGYPAGPGVSGTSVAPC